MSARCARARRLDLLEAGLRQARRRSRARRSSQRCFSTQPARSSPSRSRVIPEAVSRTVRARSTRRSRLSSAWKSWTRTSKSLSVRPCAASRRAESSRVDRGVGPQEADPGLSRVSHLCSQYLTRQDSLAMIVDSSSIQISPQEAIATMSVIESTKTFAPAGTWAADPVHSNVSFEVAYAGVNTLPRQLHRLHRHARRATRSRARRRSRAST